MLLRPYLPTYLPCQGVGAKAGGAAVVDVEDGVTIGHAEEGIGVEEAVSGGCGVGGVVVGGLGSIWLASHCRYVRTCLVVAVKH